MPTEVIHTLRASGGDYTTVSAWEAAQQRDLVAVDEIAVLECYNDWAGGLNEAATISGWTTDSTRKVIVRAAAGQGHTGVPDTGFKMIYTSFNSTAACIEIGGGVHAELIGLEAERGGSIGGGGSCFKANNVSTLSDLVCVLNGTGSNNSVGITNVLVGAKVINCIIISKSTAPSRATYSAFNSAGGDVYNSDAIDCDEGFAHGYSVTKLGVAHNCVAYGCTTSYSNMGGASTNNAASDATINTPPGTNPLLVDIVAGDFVDPVNHDYHLSLNSQLKAAGTDLSVVFTTDVDGDLRTSWDIGFDEASLAQVDTTITVLDLNTKAPIENAHVYLYKDSDKSQVFSESTNVSGVATGTIATSEVIAVSGWARQYDLLGDDYKQATMGATVTLEGVSLTVLLDKEVTSF